MLTEFFNTIFGPIIGLPPILAVAIFAFIMTTLSTLIYKFTTDQKKLRKLKSKMKSYQTEIRSFIKTDPDKAKGLQDKVMSLNSEYMQSTMKSTMFTIIPIMLIFSWLNAHIGYYPILPNQEFDVFAEFKDGTTGNIILNVLPDDLEFISNREAEIVDGKASWTLSGPEGKYILNYEYAGQSYEQDLLITNEREYKPPLKKIKKGDLLTGNIANEKVMPLSFIGIKWGWLGSYMIFSIVISMSVRKLLKIS